MKFNDETGIAGAQFIARHTPGFARRIREVRKLYEFENAEMTRRRNAYESSKRAQAKYRTTEKGKAARLRARERYYYRQRFGVLGNLI